MNINKSIAYLLAITTCLSSLSPISAKNNKSEKIFDSIIKSNKIMYTIGAIDLIATVGGIILLSKAKRPGNEVQSKKPKAIRTPASSEDLIPDNATVIKVDFKNPSLKQITQYTKYDFPVGSIKILLPDLEELKCLLNFSSLGIDSDKLASELGSIISGEPRASYELLEVNWLVPPQEANKLISKKAPTITAAEKDHYLYSIKTLIDQHPTIIPKRKPKPAKKVSFKNLSGDIPYRYYTIPGNALQIILPDIEELLEFPANIDPTELARELHEFITNINDPNKKYNLLLITDATDEELNTSTIRSRTQDLNIDRYISVVQSKTQAQPPAPLDLQIKKIVFKGADPSTKYNLYYVNDSASRILLPIIGQRQRALLKHITDKFDTIKEELRTAITNINGPQTKYEDLEIVEGSSDDILLPEEPAEELNIETYMENLKRTIPTYLKKDKKATPAAASSGRPATVPSKEQQIAEQNYISLQKLAAPGDELDDSGSDSGIPSKPLTAGTTFHIVTINGVSSCKYRAYKLKDDPAYYVLPYPEGVDPSKALVVSGPICKLALAMENVKNIDELGSVLNGNQAVMHTFSSTGNMEEDKKALGRELNSEKINWTKNHMPSEGCDGFSNYSQQIINFYTNKIKEQLRPKAKSVGAKTRSNINYYFYQLTLDSQGIETLSSDRILREPTFWVNNQAYLLPSKQTSERHYLIAPASEVNKFVQGHIPAEEKDYPRNIDNTQKVFKAIIAKNVNFARSVTAIPTPLIKAVLVTTLESYKKWEQERERIEKENKEKAEKEEKHKSCVERCTEEAIASITGCLNEPSPATGSTQEELSQSSVLLMENGKNKIKALQARFLAIQPSDSNIKITISGKSDQLPSKVDRLIISRSITLANGRKLELRGKYLKDTTRSADITGKIQDLTTDKIEVVRLGTFLSDVAKHLKNNRVNIQKINFSIDLEEPLGDGEKYRFKRNTDDARGMLTCEMKGEYLLGGKFYDDWQNDDSKAKFTQAAKKIRLV